MTAMLSTRGLGKSFPTRSGSVEVLREVNLDFFPGRFSLITGPSGSGKTTFLHLIGFLSPPTRGVIAFDGREVGPKDRKIRVQLRREDIGIVFQQSSLLPKRTVLQNVMFRNRYRKRSAQDSRSEALDALKRVGLADVADRRAAVLSGGEAQRVALARALVGRPRLVLADEPTGNLDGENAKRIVDLLSEAAQDGASVIMVTHDLSWRERADEEFRFSKGNVERHV